MVCGTEHPARPAPHAGVARLSANVGTAQKTWPLAVPEREPDSEAQIL